MRARGVVSGPYLEEVGTVPAEVAGSTAVGGTAVGGTPEEGAAAQGTPEGAEPGRMESRAGSSSPVVAVGEEGQGLRLAVAAGCSYLVVEA